MGLLNKLCWIFYWISIKWYQIQKVTRQIRSNKQTKGMKNPREGDESGGILNMNGCCPMNKWYIVYKHMYVGKTSSRLKKSIQIWFEYEMHLKNDAINYVQWNYIVIYGKSTFICLGIYVYNSIPIKIETASKNCAKEF